MRVAECSRLYFRGVLVQPIVSFARLPYISILFPILGDQTDNLVKRTLVPIYWILTNQLSILTKENEKRKTKQNRTKTQKPKSWIKWTFIMLDV